MADSDFLVTISSPALSLLFYENVRNGGDQMGFLLGETLEFVVNTYTDMDNQDETVKRYNNVQAIVTCPLPERLHNSIGRINKGKLKELLRDKSKQVIGWFRFRRNMNLTPTFRDRILHKEFASYFCNGNGSKEEFFVAGLLSSSTSNGGGTHKFKHVFLRQKHGTFEPIPLRISNLGSDSFVHEGSEYKPTPTRKSPNVPDVFSALIKSWNLDMTRTTEVECAGIIQKAAEQYFSRLIPQLCESDLEVAELERQIKELKYRRMLRVNGNSHSESEEDEINEEKQTSEKMCLPRIESRESVKSSGSSDDTNPECSSFKEVRTCQNMNAHPPAVLKHAEKNIIPSKPRGKDADTMNSPSREPPPTNPVSEMKTDVAKSVSNKYKRPSVVESEIVKEPICKSGSIGRGRGKMIHNVNSELRKSRCLAPAAIRSNSERTLHTEVSQQESSQASRVQNSSSQRASYSQSVKNNTVQTRKSGATNNR